MPWHWDHRSRWLLLQCWKHPTEDTCGPNFVFRTRRRRRRRTRNLKKEKRVGWGDWLWTTHGSLLPHGRKVIGSNYVYKKAHLAPAITFHLYVQTLPRKGRPLIAHRLWGRTDFSDTDSDGDVGVSGCWICPHWTLPRSARFILHTGQWRKDVTLKLNLVIPQTQLHVSST